MTHIRLPENCKPLLEELRQSVRREIGDCDCALLSGGIDTTFVASLHPRPSRLRAITVVTGTARDEYYAVHAAKKLGIREHIVVRLDERNVDEALTWVLQELRTIDPVEVAADIVHYTSIKTGLEKGCKCITSGDGGDELFLGYSFLYSKTEDELRRWIRRMTVKAWLPTLWVGLRLGIDVRAPLYSWTARKIALEAPIECLLDRQHGLGKLILRKHLEEIGLSEIAVREKTPVTSGSGSLILLKRLAETIGDEKPCLDFEPPSTLHSFLALRAKRAGVVFPPKCSVPDKRCPVCGRCLDENGYCKFCGTIVTEKGVVMHYTG